MSFAVLGLAMFLLLGSCAVLDRLGTGALSSGSPRPDASAAADVLPTAAPRQSQEAEPGPTEPNDAGDQPTASVPIAIPDAPGSIIHRTGEEVEVAGATIAYAGLHRDTDGIVARFRVVEGELPDARLLMPDGSMVELVQRGDSLESGPLGSHAPSPDATVTLVVDMNLVLFQAGAVLG